MIIIGLTGRNAAGKTTAWPNWHGRLPVPGTGEYEWNGLRSDLPRELNPERGWIATANHDIHPQALASRARLEGDERMSPLRFPGAS